MALRLANFLWIVALAVQHPLPLPNLINRFEVALDEPAVAIGYRSNIFDHTTSRRMIALDETS